MRTPEDDICLWARCFSCQIPILAQILVDALPHWPYVFGLVTRLACASTLRDAVLEIQPTLLDHVVNKASDLEAGSGKYVEMSIALLTSPLPPSLTIPSATQNLLICLFERTAAQPELATLRPVLRLLNGACRPLISVLPFTVLSTLEDRLMNIMRALAPVKNKTSAIYCLSIMKIILDEFTAVPQSTPTDVWDNLDSSNASQRGASQRWKPDALAHLFQGGRGLKTISLIALQVIWACTSGIEMSEPEASLTSVTVANDILNAVGATEREEWCRQNGSVILRKLQERCLVPSLSPALRLQALTFLSSLTESIPLSSQYVSAYEHLILDFGSIKSDVDQLDHALVASLPRFAPLLGNDYWETFIDSLLDKLLEPKVPLILMSSGKLIMLLKRLVDVVGESSQCRQGVISALSSFRYSQKVDRFLCSHTVAPTSAGALPYCSRLVDHNTNLLAKSFCALLLRSALAVESGEVQLPNNLVPGLLTRHAASGSADAGCQSCDRQASISRNRVLFVEVESTPDIACASLPWKEKLAMRLQVQAKDQQQAIITSFAEICQDLEKRCEGVEGPLRQEQEKLASLSTRHEQLGKAYGELEAQVMDRELRINVLEAEIESHGVQSDFASAENRNLLLRVEAAATALEHANEQAKTALAAAKRDRDQQELEHASTMACKQGAHDKVSEELQQSHHELDELREQLRQLEDSERQDNVQHEKLQKDVRELERQLREDQDRLFEAEQEKHTLTRECNDLQDELDKVRDEALRQHRQNDSLWVELEDVKTASVQEKERVSTRYEETMNNNRQEASSQSILACQCTDDECSGHKPSRILSNSLKRLAGNSCKPRRASKNSKQQTRRRAWSSACE